MLKLLRAGWQDGARDDLSYADFETADEIFVVGNYGKVTLVSRIDDRGLQPGPMFRRSRELYWEYAHS